MQDAAIVAKRQDESRFRRDTVLSVVFPSGTLNAAGQRKSMGGKQKSPDNGISEGYTADGPRYSEMRRSIGVQLPERLQGIASGLHSAETTVRKQVTSYTSNVQQSLCIKENS